MSDDKNQVVSTYMTVFEASEKWKMHQANIVKLCEDGLITGAAKLGDKWIIPKDAAKPIIPTTTSLSKPVKPKTDVQRAALEHIEKGENFYTREMVVEGKTFIVHSIFPKQGKTIEERWTSIVLNRLENLEGIKLNDKERKELMLKVRKSSSAANMTFDKYIEYYRKLFKDYGFSDEDIEVLLERKSQDYEDFIL
ncbi:MAG: helix-turn-helix domain-containing protein [Oscillospiraceae bacterium]|jgi:hypothetical protein|nr:helix-turn-helix domain-containing protein [Oscillospiraceae bacterium]